MTVTDDQLETLLQQIEPYTVELDALKEKAQALFDLPTEEITIEEPDIPSDLTTETNDSLKKLYDQLLEVYSNINDLCCLYIPDHNIIPKILRTLRSSIYLMQSGLKEPKEVKSAVVETHPLIIFYESRLSGAEGMLDIADRKSKSVSKNIDRVYRELSLRKGAFIPSAPQVYNSYNRPGG